MSRESLAAFRRTVTVNWPAKQQAGAKEHLIAVARAGHAKIMADAKADGGGTPSFEAYGNSPGRPIEAVVLPGPIVYRYSYLAGVIRAALQALREASPVVSGAYRDAHTLFINGVSVAEIPATIPAGAEIFIANPVPYARKLEVGKTESGRSFVVQVEPRIYERTMKALRGRFGNQARLSFGYVDVSGAYRLARAAKSRARKDRSVGSAVKAPAIIFEPLT